MIAGLTAAIENTYLRARVNIVYTGDKFSKEIVQFCAFNVTIA